MYCRGEVLRSHHLLANFEIRKIVLENKCTQWCLSSYSLSEKTMDDLQLLDFNR